MRDHESKNQDQAETARPAAGKTHRWMVGMQIGEAIRGRLADTMPKYRPSKTIPRARPIGRA